MARTPCKSNEAHCKWSYISFPNKWLEYEETLTQTRMKQGDNVGLYFIVSFDNSKLCQFKQCNNT